MTQKNAAKNCLAIISYIFINSSFLWACTNSDLESNSAESTELSSDKRVYVESQSTPESIELQNAQIATERKNGITEAVKRCSPAIVGINVTEVRKVEVRDPFDGFFDMDPFFDQFFRRNRQVYNQEIRGLGSGFIISPDGYILTNDHVAGTATKVVVTMTNGEKYDAEIIGSDKTTDVALLKVNANNLPYLQLSNSDEVSVGEWSIAFGNPFGLFDINAKPTVTVGVVSNTGVSFPQEGRVYRDMVQTDAAISSGNSGGPLVNIFGDVIGMNTVIFSTSQNNRGAGSIGIGFAIPINRVKKIVDMLKEHRKIDREFDPGFFVQELDTRIAKSYGLSKNDGVVIVQVKRGLSADKGGLEPGDIILEADGKRILRQDDLQVIIQDCVVDQVVAFKIMRGNDTMIKKIRMMKIKS